MKWWRPGPIVQRIREDWKRIGLFGVGGLGLLLLFAQLAYPWNTLPLNASVDGIPVGGRTVKEATEILDKSYKELSVPLYFGENKKPYRTPAPADIGLAIHSGPQIDAQKYSLWLRLVPTSVWWAHNFAGKPAPEYKRDKTKLAAYMEKELGGSCDVKPQNATVKYADKKLSVVPSVTGGTCKPADVQSKLLNFKPRFGSASVRVPTVPRPAVIGDKAAMDFADKLKTRTEKGLTIVSGSADVNAEQDTLFSWLDFSAPDSGLVASVDASKAADFLGKQVAPKVARAAGTSKVTTLDFTEIFRQDGPDGQELDEAKTIASINEWLAGSDGPIQAAVRPIPPKISFTRTYSPTDTGLTALITQFAESHPGKFGVSFAELDGRHRRATHQDDKIFESASTYKLFIAYSTLKRVESGKWQWTDQISGGRDLTRCFDDMIVKSDNACAEALLTKIGFRPLTNEMKAIGLTKTSFLNKFIETTAGDLTTFVGSLQAGQLLNPDSTNRLLGAMKRNVYRKGIPSGANGQTADKVGFLKGLLHDAAIVYSPSGTYALTIMTDGSSWEAIADLTRQIEALRARG